MAGRTVWIDLDNSPHVPFFVPIISELKKRNCTVLLTARDAFQVRELLDLYGLSCQCIGRHSGKNKLRKILGLVLRAAQLSPAARKARVDLAVSHGSRAQMLLAAALRVPTLEITDYEFATGLVLIHPRWLLMPEVIPANGIGSTRTEILKYPGIKEDVYAVRLRPDPSIRSELGVGENDIVVTMRPPADEAHYYDPRSSDIFRSSIEFLARDSRTRLVIVPRNERQGAALRQRWEGLFATGKMVAPSKVVDGLNLIWFSDLVISGGGTMNREAAALGVPVYSTFRGPTGAVDRHLAETGRLVLLESESEVPLKINVAQRNRPTAPDCLERPALGAIVDQISRILCSLNDGSRK